MACELARRGVSCRIVAQGRSPSEAIVEAATTAKAGAEATASMSPRKGRSSYLGERAIGHPDPGAEAVAIWLKARSEGN